jgi:AcrR family transcriptional regulator
VNGVHVTPARRRILAAAKSLHRRGESAVSMRKVAHQVGVTAPAIYRHFSNRQTLVEAIVHSGFDELERSLHAALDARPKDEVLAVMVAFREFAVREPRLFDEMFLRKRKSARRYPRDFAAGRSPTFAILHQVLARELAGRSDADDPLETGLTIWMLAHGLISMYTLGRFEGGSKAFAALYLRCMRRFLAGMRRRP